MLIVETKFVRDTNLGGSIRQTFMDRLRKAIGYKLTAYTAKIVAYQSTIFINIDNFGPRLKKIICWTSSGPSMLDRLFFEGDNVLFSMSSSPDVSLSRALNSSSTMDFHCQKNRVTKHSF